MRICVVVGLCSDIFFIIFINTVCVGLVSLIVLFYFIYRSDWVLEGFGF